MNKEWPMAFILFKISFRRFRVEWDKLFIFFGAQKSFFFTSSNFRFFSVCIWHFPRYCIFLKIPNQFFGLKYVWEDSKSNEMNFFFHPKKFFFGLRNFILSKIFPCALPGSRPRSLGFWKTRSTKAQWVSMVSVLQVKKKISHWTPNHLKRILNEKKIWFRHFSGRGQGIPADIRR